MRITPYPILAIFFCVSCLNRCDHSLKRYIMETEKASVGYVQENEQEKIMSLLRYIAYLDGELANPEVEGRLNLFISRATASERLARLYRRQGMPELADSMRKWIEDNEIYLDRTPSEICLLVDCLDEEMTGMKLKQDYGRQTPNETSAAENK